MLGDPRAENTEPDRVMVLRIFVGADGLLHVDRLYEAPCALGPERFYRYYNSATREFTSLIELSAADMEFYNRKRKRFQESSMRGSILAKFLNDFVGRRFNQLVR